MKGIAFLGCTWVKAQAQRPGISDAPKNIPLCPFCLSKNVEQEARPRFEFNEQMDRMVMATDPVTLVCLHPCHSEQPFEAVMDHEDWRFAACDLDVPEVQETPAPVASVH